MGILPEPPGRSAELQAPPEPRRRPHLRPREPPSATARLQAALAPPSVYPLSVTLGDALSGDKLRDGGAPLSARQRRS
eukprot:scaffold61820_cov45-Phaeocystis_antarctica.AAC.1